MLNLDPTRGGTDNVLCFHFLNLCFRRETFVSRTSESLAVEFKYVLIKLHVLSAVLLASLYVFNSGIKESVHDLF